MKNKEPLSLYIHIPFCEHICDYCDFPKLQYFRLFAENYLKAFKKELDSYKIRHQLKTIYIGGGTPTALEDDLFVELLKIVEPFTKGVREYTIEANPESLSKEKLDLMKAYGVNRISIGVESTNDEVLKNINRHHTFQDVQTAVLNARNAGFDNLNVDLIIGLPDVNKEQFLSDLKNVMSLKVEHISCYSLTVHPNTVFGIKKVIEPEEEFARDIYDLAHDFLKENGFVHYEISNWAKPGYESKHNYTYWINEPYYGVGLGASGFINDIRYTNTRNLKKYLKGEYIEEKSENTIEDDKFCTIMLNLRTVEGIDLNQYKDKYGEDLRLKYQEQIDGFINDGYLTIENEHLCPTYNGMMILDQIIMELTK